ncbi:MAG: hypothetical protein JW731_08305 [Bacteroidales bacterium]|nr:hypothetical protein [Bacteroidales bacterium]
MKKFSILLLLPYFLFETIIAFPQVLSGDPKSWTMDDFLGFDEVGDQVAATGDITSVFARVENKQLLLRVTFDDMVTKKYGEMISDNFSGQEIHALVKLKTKNSDQPLINRQIGISSLDGQSDGLEFLRTPNKNLLEFLFVENISFSRPDLLFEINIFVDGKLADSFKGDGNGSKDSGNCAFVHHGNQGLTYTNVFYGDPNGAGGLEGSGYDEVLEAHSTYSVPGNFHMSGTLMPAAEWHNPEFNDWLETLAGNGLVSMMTSALGQNIMPFATDEMNNWSVYTESQMVDHQYNYTPHIAWVPERVWLASGYYPDAGIVDLWLGDNWQQHDVWGIVLDDWPHLSGYDNRKFHKMVNGSGVELWVIPINNEFVGQMHYNAGAAKSTIASMGYGNICVYGTDWEVAAEMNEHNGGAFLENYWDVLGYCNDNYPAIGVWKLEDAMGNGQFNGNDANISTGTYGLLGGADGYGGSNNSWYINWATTPSHSDFHDPKWNYGYIWSDAFNFLMSVNDNNLAQLGWYTLMINLHETGWHTDGQVADWEHRYSSHIKNANVYTEASRWADGQYTETTACYFEDIDRDGMNELVMHNDKVFIVFESIGGKANWIFYKNGFGQAYSVVSSDMAYWSETEGDYNEGSSNHFAALSDVSPNQQNSIYNISVDISSGSTVQATLDQWGVQKVIQLSTENDFLDVIYNFYDQTGYVKSGWSPDLLDLIWSGKSHLQRMWGENGSYCGYRNSSSGATAALILGNGGASHNLEFEGTLVKGDEIYGYNQFKVSLFAGYTSNPSGTTTIELNNLATQNMDVFSPVLYSPAALISDHEVILTFSESVSTATAENITNYSFQDFTGTYTLVSAQRQGDWRKVKLTVSGAFAPGDMGEIVASNIEDLYGNAIESQNTAQLHIPNGFTPHPIVIDGMNDFSPGSELIESQTHDLYITWDNDNLYLGFHSLIFQEEGDLLINMDTDQTPGNGATLGSWTQVDFVDPYLPEYQIAIENYDYHPVNIWNGSGWTSDFTIGTFWIGWSGNDGYTEISIPWNDLGNPSGIAISAHVSEENTDIVTEVFPSLNSTGDHPVMEYFYAFFTPYIDGPMPLSGFEPNSVFVVPNTSPQIVSFDPAEQNIDLEVNSSQLFNVTAADAENDEIIYTWKLDGITVGGLNSFNWTTDENDVGNHTLEAIISDDVPGNSTDQAIWNISVIEPQISLDIKVYLEGPYGTTEMNTDLYILGMIPLIQPYSIAPWNYPGTEEVLNIPGINIVDWVLVELRDATDPATATEATIIAKQAAFVDKYGNIKGINGSQPLTFQASYDQNLYIVVWHRNHLGILSNQTPTENEGTLHYDFTTGVDKVYGGADGYKQMPSGDWAMVGGDSNADETVDDLDKANGWAEETGLAGYLNSDYSLNGNVNNQDKNDIWYPNDGAGSQIEGSTKHYKCQVTK